MRARRLPPFLPPPPDPRADADDGDPSEESGEASNDDGGTVAIGRISPLPRPPATPAPMTSQSSESGWFAKGEPPPTSVVPAPRSSAAPRRSRHAVEESDLFGVETSRGRRYSFIAPRGGRRLGQK